MRQMSEIEQMIKIIKANIDLSYHSYDCTFLQEGAICDCDTLSDDEIATLVFRSYGYKLIKDDNEQQQREFFN